MKAAMFLFALFVVLMVVGCQESKLVNPTSQTAEKSSISQPASINEPVEFSFTVLNPYKSPQEFFDAKGRIQFVLIEIPSPDLEKKTYYELKCLINGELYAQKTEGLLGWGSTDSFDEINFENGYVVIQKTMEVQDSVLPLVINLRLTVYPKTIEVSDVWLTTPEMARR